MSVNTSRANLGDLDSGYVNPEIESDYVIWVDGTTYYAKNGRTGKVTSNVNAATLINACISALTGGRTWKEIITVKGSITLTTSITMDSWMVLDLSDAYITTSTSGITGLIYASSKTDFDIIGGSFYGSDTPQECGIRLETCSRVRIVNPKIDHMGRFAIDLNGSNTLVSIYKPIFSDSGEHGIHIYASNQCSVIDGYGTGSTSIAYDLDGASCYENEFIGCYAVSNSGAGFNVYLGISNRWIGCYSLLNQYGYIINGSANSIGNCVAKSNTEHGFFVEDSANTFTGIISQNNMRHGICIYGGSENKFSGGIITDNDYANTASWDGINIDADSDRNEFIGFLIRDNDNYEVKIANANCDNNKFVFNDFTGSDRQGVLSDSGTGTKMNFNQGFVTEYSGTATILNATTSVIVPHGCSYTPTATDISITPTATCTNDPGMIWVSAIDATNFTVNCLRDPGASGLAFSWAVRRV